MNNERICASCKIGKETYARDCSDTFCPYIHCHSGSDCTMYTPIEKTAPKDIADKT